MSNDPFFQTLEDLVQDGSYATAMERLYFMTKVETGLKQAAEGDLLDQQTVWERMRTWLV